MAKELSLIALAGALGTLARYGLSALVYGIMGQKFPWGTLAVNAIGCFLFGLIWVLAEERLVISGQTRFVILTGFMGAFTTFSTFGFESAVLLRDSEWMLATLNVVGHIALGIICVFAGFAAGRLI